MNVIVSRFPQTRYAAGHKLVARNLSKGWAGYIYPEQPEFRDGRCVLGYYATPEEALDAAEYVVSQEKVPTINEIAKESK